MSVAVVMQVMNKGMADAPLNVDPDVSYWKRSFQRVSAHGMVAETWRVNSFGYGKEFNCELKTHCDLIQDSWMTLDIAPVRLKNPGKYDTVHFSNSLGHALLSRVHFTCGHLTINTMDGRYLEIKDQFSADGNKDMDETVLRSRSKKQLIHWAYHGNAMDRDEQRVIRLYIHLPFYFTMVRSQAFPACALHYGGLRVHGEFRKLRDLLVFSNPNNTELDPEFNGQILQAGVLLNTVYLNEMERTLFCVNTHEYVIRDLHISEFNTKPRGAPRLSVKIEDFLHPTTALYFTMQRNSCIEQNDYFNFERTPGLGDDPFLRVGIKLGVNQREEPIDPIYYKKLLASKYWSRTPDLNVYGYNFAQFPLEWFPSGECNFSKIEGVTFDFTLPRTDANGDPFEEAEVVAYAEHFNFLKFSYGQIHRRFA